MKLEVSEARSANSDQKSDPNADARGGFSLLFTGARLKDRWRRNFRARRLTDGYLLTADHGEWLILSVKEFTELSKISISDQLFSLLEERGLILTEANAALVEKKWRDWCRNYYIGTSLHILGVTRRCNLRCSYCHVSVVPEDADSKRFDMTGDVGFKIVDFAFQSPSTSLHFEFQGGEATLNMGLVRAVYDYARLKNLRHKRHLGFSLVTNLINLPEDTYRFLQDACIGVSTTVEYSDSQERALRIFPDGRSSREEHILGKNKARAFGITAPALLVVARNNIGRLKNYIDSIVESGQMSVFLSPVQRLGFAKGNWDEVGVPMSQFNTAWRDAMNHIFALWDQGIFIQERSFFFALEKLFAPSDIRYMDFRNPNGMVFGNLAYDQAGDVFACDEGRGHTQFKIGNVFRQSYDEVIASEKARELVSYSLREHETCNACAYKPWCGVSPVISWGHTGNCDPEPLTDPMCQRTMGIFDFVGELLQKQPDRIRQALMIHAIHNSRA